MDAEFVQDGYIRVYQDIRGRGKSEGEFVMNRPIRGVLNKTTVDEATDAYDTIDWLVKNVPESNGKVGTTGSSYPRFLLSDGHHRSAPRAQAVCPRRPMTDGCLGDDWYHNGAFRQPNFDFVTGLNRTQGAQLNGRQRLGRRLRHVPECGLGGDYAKAYGLDSFPFIQKMFQNPAYTAFWSEQAVDRWLKDRPLTVPTMLVVGQWDQLEQLWRAQGLRNAGAEGRQQRQALPRHRPLAHPGVNYIGTELGPFKFPGDTALHFRTHYMKPFLDHYLKGAPDPKIPPVATFATGVNKWDELKAWPLGSPTPLYLQANGALGWTKPGDRGCA